MDLGEHPYQVATCEFALEGFGDRFIVALESRDALGDGLQRAEVVGCERFALAGPCQYRRRSHIGPVRAAVDHLLDHPAMGRAGRVPNTRELVACFFTDEDYVPITSDSMRCPEHSDDR